MKEMIDSGLGWACDKDYFANTENQHLSVDRIGNDYCKYNDTPAIAVKVKRYGGFNSLVIISTKQDGVLCTPLHLSFIDGKTNIDGITWYLGSPMYGVDSDNDPSPDLEWLNEDSPMSSGIMVQDLVKKILAKANVIVK